VSFCVHLICPSSVYVCYVICRMRISIMGNFQ
jgi:hypothetical protein